MLGKKKKKEQHVSVRFSFDNTHEQYTVDTLLTIIRKVFPKTSFTNFEVYQSESRF